MSSNLDFENKAARDWNLVDFTSPRGQLALGSKIKQRSRISLKFGKFSLTSIRQFLGTSYHSFQRVFKEDLKRVSDRFCRYELATKPVSTCCSTFFLSETSSYFKKPKRHRMMLHQNCSSFNPFVRWPKSVTANSIWSRQFHFDHGNFNLNFPHGNCRLREAWTRKLGCCRLDWKLLKMVEDVLWKLRQYSYPESVFLYKMWFW